MTAIRTGYVYRHARFYADRETGELRPKYLIALAYAKGGDIVAGILTSRQHGRPQEPPCYHGRPYAGFFLGYLGAPLTANSWVNLNELYDLDSDEAARCFGDGTLVETRPLPGAIYRALLECAAAALDTTVSQERAIRNHLATLPVACDRTGGG